MKTIIRLLSLITFSIVFFSACKKDETKVYYTGGTPPTLTLTAGADTLSYANAAKTVITLNWSNPNYTFNTGVSSLDVTYQLEIDTVGSNFTNPHIKIINISKDLSYSFTSADLNDIMLNQLNLKDSMQHNLEFRVVSYAVSTATNLVSNSIQYKTTAYAIPPKVTPPALGTLYIVGSAVGNWDNPIDQGNVSKQQFTQMSPTDYQITIPIIGDGEYKLIESDGSWDNQWSVKTEQPSGDPSTLNADLYFNGANARAPLVSATYLIDVDFQKGKITLTKQ